MRFAGQPLDDRLRTAAVLAAGAGLLGTAWWLRSLPEVLLPYRDYVTGEALMLLFCAAGTALLWRRARRRDVAIVLVVALAARLMLAAEAPRLSDDAYRFVWDGRVQSEGVNPYAHAPAAERLIYLRDWRIFTRVNRPYTRTLYPPSNQVAFFASHRVAGDGITKVRLSWIALEACVVVLILLLLARTRRPAGRVALYAWHPLALVEIAGSGHPEPLLLLPTLAALLLWDRGRRLGAGVALGIAALTKFVPLLLGPFMFRRLGGRFVAGALAAAALLYLPYAGAGTAALGSIGAYAEERFGAGPYHWLVNAGVGDGIARGVLLAALSIGVAAAAARPPRDLVQACRYAALLFGGALLASHNVLPWYALWVLPLLCVVPVPALLWLCSTISVYYLVYRPDRTISQGVASAIVWGPTLALLGAGAIRSGFPRRREEAARAPGRAGAARAPA
jgi:alpha-1,6-mannosyltransferase